MFLICFVQEGVGKLRYHYFFPFHECEKCRLTVIVGWHDWTDDRQKSEFNASQLKMCNEGEQTCDSACVMWHVWFDMCDLACLIWNVWFDIGDSTCVIWLVWLVMCDLGRVIWHVWLDMCDSTCLCVIWDLWINMCDLINNVAPNCLST